VFDALVAVVECGEGKGDFNFGGEGRMSSGATRSGTKPIVPSCVALAVREKWTRVESGRDGQLLEESLVGHGTLEKNFSHTPHVCSSYSD
jgi:hypothetical protein